MFKPEDAFAKMMIGRKARSMQEYSKQILIHMIIESLRGTRNNSNLRSAVPK